MSQWKVGDGEYIPAHDMDGTTLLSKHSVPHTPTPSLSLYELSGQGNTFVHPTTPWTLDDQRRQKHYSTTNTESVTRSDGTVPYQQQQVPEPGNKQLWTRQGKSPNKPPPMDYTSSSLYPALHTTNDSTNNSTTTTDDVDNNNKGNNQVTNGTNNISYTSSTAPSSLIHPLTNIYMDLHTDGSSVRIMPSQVIPPVTLPTNQNQDHRVGSQGMVAINSQQNSMKQQSHQYYQQQQQQQQQQHQSQNQPMHQQLTPRSEHSHYSDDRDNHHHHYHHRRATKYPYSRSFSDTPHSLLPYHHHSSQHRHNSIAIAEQAAVRAAAVAAAYQSHPMNSSQMTWYTQNSTFQKSNNPIYTNSATSSPRVAPSISKHPNDPEICQDSNSFADGSTFAPMSDLLSSSRMDDVEYDVQSSTTTTLGTTNSSTHALGPQRHSNQWTSSSSASSPRISDMHSLLSMSFSPNDTYNTKDGCATSLDQQSNDEEKHGTADFGNDSNSAMMTSSSNTIRASSDSSALHSKKPPLHTNTTTTATKIKAKKSTQRPQKPHTGKRRSPNAFFVFCSERRQILKQGKPNARNTDINRQLGDDWKALTQEERDWYKQKADRIRAELPNGNTPTPGTLNTPSLVTHNNTDTPPCITFTTLPTTNDGSHSTSDHQIHQNHTHHHQHHQPTTFDLPFTDFANTNSPTSRINRDNSAMTIAVDDDSVTSDGTGSGDQHSSKRGSLANSDFSSSSSQRPLNVASLSLAGAAEANALDQATLAGFHSSNYNDTTTNSNRNNNNNINSTSNSSSAATDEKPERLKRPPNAYLLFNREMRRKLLDQNENLTVALISKLISQSWHDLPQDTKDGYINAAAKLKQQHLEDHPNYVYSRRSRSELAQAGYRSRPSKKRKKMLEEEIDRLNADGTTTNGNDITKNATGDNVNHISDPEWTSSSSSPSAAGAFTTSAQKDDTKQQLQQRRKPDPRGRKKKKHKNPLGPKHPMSGFLFFASHARPEAVKQHPKSKVGMISKVIAEQWKKMTDQEKQPWVDKAEADKARYAKEMEAFNLAQEQKEMEERQQQQQQQQHLTNERMDGHDDNGYTNDGSVMGHQMKKTSISSLSSSTSTSFKDDQHPSESLSLAAGGSKESLDLHSRQQQQQQHHHHHHHMDYHHLHHHHRADIDQHPRQRHNDWHHYSKHPYKPSISRIHSALASSRSASPTELDSDTIATVAQMVNPKNQAPVPIPSGSTSSNSTTRDRLHLTSSFHQQQQHPSSTPSLTSIMHHHHHDNHSVSNLQLHVPATPPSPAIDTI